MSRALFVVLLSSLASVLLAFPASAAEPQVPRPPAEPASATSCATIHAVANAALTQLTLDGSFACADPVVYVGTPGGLLVVATPLGSGASFIDVELPAGTTPGTYLVNVQCGRESCFMDVTLGAVGAQGPQGPIGLTGATGAQGAAGPAGANGATGAQGPAGPAGANGATGAQGPAGPAGANGATGAQGPAGPAGANGATGAQGPAGPAGANGATGAQGPAGPAGANGATGAQGPAGPAGANGATGAQGPAGPAGANGATGAQGPVGPAGPAGSQAAPPQGSLVDRFKDNGNGTVTDGQTGLIWLKDWGCGGGMNWVQGIAWAAALANGQCGLTDGSSAGDWRMPTFYEWNDDTTTSQNDSMLKPSCPDGIANIPDTNGTGCWSAGNPFVNAASSKYWSATSNAGDPSAAWDVNLFTGLVLLFGKTNFFQVVAVRGGP